MFFDIVITVQSTLQPSSSVSAIQDKAAKTVHMAAVSCSETLYSTIKMVSYQVRLESSNNEIVQSSYELDIAVYSEQPSQTHV
jgi:hypothetical protein